MPNPFYEAQAGAAVDPSQGQIPTQVPQGLGAGDGSGAPYPDINQGVPPIHTYDEIGAIRDSILKQFPDIMAPDEPPMNLDTTQKLTMFGLFLANPQGALDMIRARRERQAKRDQLRAELGLKAVGLAGEMLKSQNEVSKGILEMHLKANQDWRERKKEEFQEHIERGKFALSQAAAARSARAEADARQMQDFLMGRGDEAQPGEGAILAPGTPNPITGETGGQSLTPEATATISPTAKPVGSGYTPTFSFSPKGGMSVTFSPTKAGKTRDPRVDFDGWLRGFIARYPMGRLPAHLRPSDPEGYANLVALWQKERGALAPGSFGAAGGAYPTPHVAGPVRLPGEAGYSEPQGDEIEQLGR